MSFSKILLAYDGSEVANKALEKAVQLTNMSENSVLEVLHVYDFPRVFIGEGLAPIPPSVNNEVYELAEQTVEEAKKRLAAMGADAQVELIQGSPVDVIVEYIKQNNTDLIVIGSRGLSGIREFMLGSVSHRVAQEASIPVLIVK
ncbi:universal stress protein [Paenibacillus sp. Marseille-Q4541]|uniref:universal stress protein n=1 Tax=Paenibacillus sp. Marseille-Q4541 TaxID=2831522 RepID=UPI001BA9BECE|nr:universal stress protein [Paenibacillus sp. Marseille-Q4541]